MTQPSATTSFGSWAAQARAKLKQIRADRAQAFTGHHYETEDSTVTMAVGPNLELRSCRIRPLASNFRDVLEREVVRAYNTAMTEAVVKRTEAYRALAETRKNGA